MYESIQRYSLILNLSQNALFFSLKVSCMFNLYKQPNFMEMHNRIPHPLPKYLMLRCGSWVQC
jgi:hypothetical protein